MRKLLSLFTALFTIGTASAQDIQAEASNENVIKPRSMTYAISPIRITEENIGLGISVEKFFGDNDIISLYLPFSMSFAPTENGNSSDYYSNYGGYEKVQYEKEFFHFYPGIKIYPTGAFKKVSYAIGINAVAGVGRIREYNRQYSYPTGPYWNRPQLVSEQSGDISRLKIGAMLFNSLNVRPTERFYLGVEFGLGYTYVNRVAGESRDRGALVQLGVSFGLAL